MLSTPQNILIYRLGSLGDTVIALPCFHKVRECYPNAEITLLTNRPVKVKAAPIESVLGTTGYFFNQVLDYPIGTRNPLVLLPLIWKIRQLRIDAVINLTAPRSKASVERDKYFFRTAGIKKLIGFSKKHEDIFLVKDPFTNEYEWEAKRLARRIETLGMIDLENPSFWDLRLTTNEEAKADNLLAKISTSHPIIVVSPGTKMQSKDWGVDNWTQLLSRLRHFLPNWQLVMIGAAEEEEVAFDCLTAWGTSGVNLCGKASPRVSAAVLQKAQIFIGHDSGPMHLAACVGTPCVAIFSARNLPRRWFPRGSSNEVLYHQTDCAGCNLEVCIEQKKKCILSITVEEVLQAVLQLINKQLTNRLKFF